MKWISSLCITTSYQQEDGGKKMLFGNSLNEENLVSQEVQTNVTTNIVKPNGY